MMIAIRGATTIQENTKTQILEASEELLKCIIVENNIKIDEITSILFTATKDVTKAYPAVAARQLGITQAALMCVQEMYVEESLPMCIRVMMQIQRHGICKNDSPTRHIYLHEAKKLRPDLISKHSVAIDGPAGAGKSTIAKKVAESLGCVYIDTGAMYRAVAYYCKQKGIDWEDESKVNASLEEIDIKIKNQEGAQHLYLNNEDVTELVRTQEVASGASVVAAYEKVRKKLVQLQRNLALEDSVVMDGRDIGTHVLKDASAKFFLTASVSERAMRRVKELDQRGQVATLDEISRQITERDYNDMNREFSPLCKAVDAIEIDTTTKSIDEVTNEILKVINGGS